jgi:hypothetical protein
MMALYRFVKMEKLNAYVLSTNLAQLYLLIQICKVLGLMPKSLAVCAIGLSEPIAILTGRIFQIRACMLSLSLESFQHPSRLKAIRPCGENYKSGKLNA